LVPIDSLAEAPPFRLIDLPLPKRRETACSPSISSQVHVFLGFFSEEIQGKNGFDATSSEANGGSERKMRLSIVISTLKNPETQCSTELNFSDCADICLILMQTGSYRLRRACECYDSYLEFSFLDRSGVKNKTTVELVENFSVENKGGLNAVKDKVLPNMKFK
ncbi:hypothetical protein PRIPAC_72849, partial [Pristionchus pacificus]|uniref:Uncharacterized protein n=1 Tax=Pristionchus pacificus TaxID=54126 RepID=A0A2A6B4E0_PRIPA